MTRIFGLDVMRAIAVSLVVVGHFLQHPQPVNPLPPAVVHFGRLGILGVEIFFVLSGFLIGGIILRLLEKGRFESFADLRSFWVRRWMRTLPLYYLMFLIYLRYDWTGPSRLVDRWQFLIFMQNFAWPGPDFFLLSWSLTIEEYFYLLFPLLLWLIHRDDARKSVPAAILVFLLVPLAVKWFRTPYPDWDGFNYNVRMETITRLDSLMYGVGAVFLKHYHPGLWARLLRWTRFTALAVVAVAIDIWIDIPGLAGNRVWQTLFFPLTSLSIALVLPWLDAWRLESLNLWQRAVTFVSTVSYSTYLGHILVLTLVNNLLGGKGSPIYQNPFLLYPIYAVLVMALTPLTYYGWELPFLKLRDRAR